MISLGKIIWSDLGKIFAGNIVIQISTVFQTIITSRILGPEDKGHFIEIILWPTVISGFSILGLYTGIAKLSANEKIQERYDLVKTTLQATSIVGIIGFIISLFLTPLLVNKPDSILIRTSMIFSSFVLINNIARGFNAIDHGQKNFSRYSITRAMLNPIFFLFLLALYILGEINIETVVFALLASNFCVAAVRVILAFRHRTEKLKSYPLKTLFKYSIRYAPSDLSEPIYAYYDKAIMASVLLSFDLGIYTTAYSAASIINIIPNVYGIKLFSDVASLHNPEHISSAIRQNIILMSLCCIAFAPLLPILIPLVFGNEFSSAILPSILLLITCTIQGLSFVIERGVLALGYPYMGIKAKGIAMILMCVLALFFKIFGVINIYSMILIVTICQILYYIYMMRQLKSISSNICLIPRIVDFKIMKNRFLK